MKKYLLLLSILFVFTNLFSQDTLFSKKIIDSYETAKSKALNNNDRFHEYLWLTPIINEAKSNWNRLTPEAKSLFDVLSNRPSLLNEQIGYTSHFDFHFTTTGVDAVDPTDSDGSGFPDYVEKMAYYFEYVWLNDSIIGFTPPPPDGTEGGDEYYDIYLVNLPAMGFNGLLGATPTETNVYDNPNSSTLTEWDAYTTWIAINNEFNSYGNEDTLIATTAAHEFMHAIQFGYSFSMETWFKEMTAVWAEDLHFPGYGHNLNFLQTIYDEGFFGMPDAALNLDNVADNLNGTELFDHWYGSWIFAKYLTEHTDNSIIRYIYEGCINNYALDAIDFELTDYWSSSFDEIFGNFLIANAILQSTPAYEPYTYSRAAVYDNYIQTHGGYYPEGDITFTGSPASWNSYIDGNGRLMRLSGDYIYVDANQNFSISLTPDNSSANMDMALIKYNSTGGFAVDFCNVNGNSCSISVTDAANYDTFIAVIARLDNATTDTLSEQYLVTVEGLPLSADFTSNTTSICAGSTVYFTDITSGSPTSWQWDFGDGSTSTLQNPSHTYSTNGTYSVTLTVNDGNTSDTYTENNYITVNPNPTANAGTDQYISTGSPATLTATSGTSYTWSNGGNTQSITVYPTSTTIYTVTVYNSAGCSATDNVIVYVTGAALSISTTATPSTLCSGNIVQLNSLPSGGNGTYTYAWSSNPTGFTSSLQNPTVSPTTNTTYTVTVTSGANTATSFVSVTVNPTPVLPTISVNGNQLTSSASSGNQWYYNGSIIGGATSQTYTATQSGAYYVIVTNGNACSNTSTTYNYAIPTGQPFVPELVSAAGDYFVNGTVALEWSIGECLIETKTGTNNMVTQGFHQSNYVITLLSETTSDDYLISVYPNPTSDNITVDISSGTAGNLQLKLFDIQGKLLINEKIKSEEKTKTLNLQTYSKGLYILNIYNNQDVQIKTYKIEKIN